MRAVMMIAMLLAGTVSAGAQPVAFPRPDSGAGREIRVQVNINFFVAGPVSQSEDSLKAQENARRSLYDRAGKECDLLKATIAAECRLVSVNVNINRQFGQQEGFNANGSFAFGITPK